MKFRAVRSPSNGLDLHMSECVNVRNPFPLLNGVGCWRAEPVNPLTRNGVWTFLILSRFFSFLRRRRLGVALPHSHRSATEQPFLIDLLLPKPLRRRIWKSIHWIGDAGGCFRYILPEPPWGRPHQSSLSGRCWVPSLPPSLSYSSLLCLSVEISSDEMKWTVSNVLHSQTCYDLTFISLFIYLWARILENNLFLFVSYVWGLSWLLIGKQLSMFRSKPVCGTFLCNAARTSDNEFFSFPLECPFVKPWNLLIELLDVNLWFYRVQLCILIHSFTGEIWLMLFGRI